MKTIKRFTALTGMALLLLVSACKKDSDTNPGNNGNNGNGNQVPSDSLPKISTFSPTSGAADTVVTITGSAFSNDKSTITVKFGTTAATDIVSATTTQIKVKVPKAASPGNMKITVNVAGKESTSTNEFIINPPPNTWTKLYGGNNSEETGYVWHTSDGGYVMTGWTLSNNSGDVGANKGDHDIWIIKVDADGNKVWQKTYGGAGSDVPSGITGTPNGGVLITGSTYSNNSGDVGPTNGNNDMWVLNLDANGNLLWQKTIGGPGLEYGGAVIPSGDGGFVIAEMYYPFQSNADFLILKLDANGNVLWQKSYGGSGNDVANGITASNDGGFVVCGYTQSNNSGDVGANHGSSDAWVVKVDASGNLAWQKTLGGSGGENAYTILSSGDGGYIVSACTGSNNDGDVGASHGGLDTWVVKLNGSGNVVWQKAFGGLGNEFPHAATLGSGGNYVIASYSQSTNSGDVVGINQGSQDIWTIKVSVNGDLLGQSMVGGNDFDEVYGIVPATGGGYAISGYTRSFVNGGAGPNHGGEDLWLVKIKEL